MLTIEVIATDGIGLAMDGNARHDPADRDRRRLNVPLTPTGVDNTYRGTIDFDDARSCRCSARSCSRSGRPT